LDLGLLVHNKAVQIPHEVVIMTFGLYLVGFIILIVGLALGAYLVHVPAMWIGVGVIILVGLGVMMGVATTRQRDPSN
jgi:hypothetical protein